MLGALIWVVPEVSFGQEAREEEKPAVAEPKKKESKKVESEVDEPTQKKTESSEKSVENETVVVTASRLDMSVFNNPASVTVLTTKEIEESPFERIEDIVRRVPGLFNFRHYGVQRNGIISSLSMRGVGKNKVLVMVDGVPQNDNFNNAISWVAWGHIPKNVIERIEIIRGPTSALHGSEGLGGVINIVTKNPKPARKTSVRAEGGTANTYAGYGFLSEKVGDFGFLFGGGYEKSDGFYMVEQPKSYEIERYRDAVKVFGKMTYDLGPSSGVSFGALFYDHETGKGRKYFYDELTLYQYLLDYYYKSDFIDVKALAYLSRADKKAFQDTAKDDFTSLLRVERMPCLTWGADLQATMHVFSWASVTLGGTYRSVGWDFDNEYVTIDRDAGAKARQHHISPFANLGFNLLDNTLIVNLGARYDWINTLDGANWDSQASAGKTAYDNTFDSNWEGSFSPTLGVAWHPDDRTTVRATAGKGFRAPSLFELFKVHVRQGGAYYREANPDLAPEEIWSYDVGVERFLTDDLWAKLTFYQSFASDYIGDRLTGTGEFSGGKTRYEYEFDNISEVGIYGIEAELRWDIRKDLIVFANYTLNFSKIKKDENDANLEGNYMAHDPRHMVHAGLSYQNPSLFNVSLIGNYYGDIYFDAENTLHDSGYITVDVSLARRFSNNITAFVNAENIFNEKYPILLSLSGSDTIAPGVVVSAGLKMDF